ncbi:hypothetical protein C8J56DRAFT_922917 [Mycena floridula]|nr:hypothetical protein C8J56DRAFT_922917 [Mycena floridula]
MGTSLDVKKGPWVYGKVCRIWRREILSRTGTIWSRISIIHSKTDDSKVHSAAILREILSRSSQQPLHLSLHLQSDSAVAKDILAIAVGSSSRWETARLLLTTQLTSRLKKLKSRIPLLEALHLQFYSGPLHSNSISSKNISDCFQNAPALHRLTFYGFRDVHSLNVAFSQLTHFHDTCGDSPCLSLLPKLPSLISLSLSPREKETTSRRFQFTQLRSLDLSSCHRKLPSCLELPALEVLKISAENLDTVSIFIQQSSSSQLTHVSIFADAQHYLLRKEFFDGTILSAFFRAVPLLSTLEFSGRRLGRPVLSMVSLLTDMRLVQSLRCIIFDKSLLHEKFESLKTLVSVVQARRKASISLEEIQFTVERLGLGNGYVRDLNDILPENWAHLETIRATGSTILMDQPASSIFEVTDI